MLRNAIPGKPEVGEAIAAINRLAQVGMLEGMMDSRVCVNSRHFHNYLLSRLQNSLREQVLAVFLDREGGFISENPIFSGSCTSMTITSRPIIERAFELNAAGFVLVHNHPSGLALPSTQDWSTTKDLRAIGRALDCFLVDHLIVGHGEIYSMAREAYLLEAAH